MRSTFLDTTALSQPLPTPPGLLDARQIEHLRLADDMEARMRSLPRVGATFTAQALFHGAWAHRMMSTMTLDEERSWLADEENEPEVLLSSKRGSISSTFPDGRIAFEGTYDYLKISEEGAA